MARRQHHNSISLFPFLAVLVCAMGALILLLLVMTRRIRQEQVEQAVVTTVNSVTVTPPDRSEEVADLESRVRTAQETLTQKQSQVEALNVIVDDRRSQLKSLQQELDELQQRVAENEPGSAQKSVAENLQTARQLSAKEAALLRQLKESEKLLLEKQQLLTKANEASREASRILQQKNSALISLRAQVQSVQEKQKSSGTSTLLEFTNSTGTTRTPIVIDVSDRGFEILPNGISITAADMEGFPVRDNPLLSAILTTHRHRSGNSVTNEPYVLLLVRPDGCLVFYGAQRILVEAGIHYGYELLERDREIAGGDADPSEVPVVQAAMNEAFKRRENLYAKLMAIAQQKGALPGADGEPQSGTGERRLTLRPDGRIIVDEDASRRPLEGRFYAGGAAPPDSLLRNRPVGGYGGVNSDRLSARDAEKLAEQFAEQYAKQQAAARSAATAMDPPEPATPVRHPGSEESIRSPGERRFADAVFGSDGSLQGLPAGAGGAEGLAGNQLPRGTGGAGGTAGFSEMPAEQGHLAGSTAQPSGAGQPSFEESISGTTTQDYAFSPPSARHGANTDESDWLQSSLLAGEAGSNTSATSPAATSPAGSPKAGAPGKSGTSSLFAGQSGDTPSTGMPDLSRIDAEMLRSLQAGQHQSGSLSTPVGIVVFLDEHHMTIGQQRAIAVTRDSLDAAFAALLQGIHTEVEDARRKPNEPIMPIVRFIVSPGGEKWRIPLAHSLKRIGIRSAAVFELTPYITAGDNTGRARLDEQSEL